MIFQELVQNAKLAREAVQETPAPFLPPALWCFDSDGHDQCALMSPKATETAIAGMLSMIPVAKSDSVIIGLEAYVRPEDKATTVAINEDPWAQPALILMRVTRSGEVETSINPYAIDDSGSLVWAQPGAMVSPMVAEMIRAIQDIFALEIEDGHTRDLLTWLFHNGYQVRIEKGMLDG